MNKDKLVDQDPKPVESINNSEIHQSSDNDTSNTVPINLMQPLYYYLPPYLPEYYNQYYMYFRNGSDGNDQNLPFNNTFVPYDSQFYPDINANVNTNHKNFKQQKKTCMDRNMVYLTPSNSTNNLPSASQHDFNQTFQKQNQIYNQYLPNYHLDYYYQIYSQYFNAQLASNFNNLNLNKEFIPCNNIIDNRPAYSQNEVDFKFNGESEGSKDSRFFVIKSYSAEDVIHGIKNNIWCSTDNGNKKLNQAFNECSKKKYGSVYLFFSINGSGHFCGMAEMTSEVDFNTKLDFWAQDKWRGKISLKWIFVKDIPNRVLKNIILPNNEDKPITKSRDTQEVFFDQAIQVVYIFRTYKANSNIIFDFDLTNRLKNSSNDHANNATTYSGEKSKRPDHKNS